MIAERPKAADSAETDNSSLSLFAGLSFPDVPSHPLQRTLPKNEVELQVIKKKDSQEYKEIQDETEAEDTETTKLLSAPSSSSVKKTEDLVESPIRNSASLSTLYATEVTSFHSLVFFKLR
jgi:hypothetical protein